MSYIAGQGHQHLGPGTSMVQFVSPNYRIGGGMGRYDLAAEYNVQAGGHRAPGLACCGMGCGCGQAGMGLFDSGTDFTGWGMPEWALVGIGAYMVFSTLFTTRRGIARVGEGVRRTRKRVGKSIAG